MGRSRRVFSAVFRQHKRFVLVLFLSVFLQTAVTGRESYENPLSLSREFPAVNGQKIQDPFLPRFQGFF